MELPLLVSVPLTLAFHCVEMSGKVCRKHSSLFSPNNDFVILRFLWWADPFPPLPPSCPSPSGQKRLLVLPPCPHLKDLCFTDSLKVNSSILTASPCFHAFKINKSVFSQSICKDGISREDASPRDNDLCELPREEWASPLRERRLDEVGYLKYFQALEPQVSEMRMIGFTQAHAYNSFTFLFFFSGRQASWVFPM